MLRTRGTRCDLIERRVQLGADALVAEWINRIVGGGEGDDQIRARVQED